MIRINGKDNESMSATPSPEMGLRFLYADKKLYEPQRGTDFELVIPNLDGITDVVDGRSYDNAEQQIRLAVASCPVPHFNIQSIEQRRGNDVIRYAGTPKFDVGGDIKVRDWIGADIVDILYAWQNKAYNVKTAKTGLMEDYMKNAYLIQYSPDRQVVRTWLLHDLWLSKIAEDTFDNSEDQKERFLNCTFIYSLAEIVDLGYEA